MTGYFNSPFPFSVGIPNDYSPLALMNFSPQVGIVNWTWNCDPFECVGQGIGNVIGGPVGGVIPVGWITFHGLILSGSFQDDRIIDLVTGQIYLDTQTYDYAFSGLWTNGWVTLGEASAEVDLNGRGNSGYQLTTYTPEPATILLAGVFIATSCRRVRLLTRSRKFVPSSSTLLR